jgi:kanamycin nucleotidyltransferase
VYRALKKVERSEQRMNGPGMMSREERWRIANEIAGRAMEHCGSRLKAVGVYGSLALGTDGPFSDIEMFCVLRSSGESRTYEWSADL